MSKHTQGPWYALPLVLQVVDKNIWFDDDGSRHGDTPNMVIDCGSVADTHLIAAAPDLLDALMQMVAIHDEPSGFDGKYGKALDEAIAAQRHKIDERLSIARAAIAKAKGV